jgi:hypothetical protein
MIRISFLSAFCIFLASAAAHAASDSVKHHAASPEMEHYYGSNQMAVGVAATDIITNGESATALFSNHHDWIQTYLAVYTTKGNFDFAVGGAYKFTVAGTRNVGFHVGPGFTVGTVGNSFAFAIFGAAGGHFTFAEHFFISVDAGPMVTHTDSNTNFRLRGLGNYLGMTIAYIF